MVNWGCRFLRPAAPYAHRSDVPEAHLRLREERMRVAEATTQMSKNGVTITGARLQRIGSGAVGIRVTNCGPVKIDGIDMDQILGHGVIVEPGDNAKPSEGMAKRLVTGVAVAAIAKALGL